MVKWNQASFIMLSITVFALTGCAPQAAQPTTQRQVNALQAQVGVLTDELVRLDQQLQAMRASLQEGQNRTARAGAITPIGAPAFEGAMYRTPGGFELPAVSIQQALRNAGYNVGTIDGKVGPQTREAVRSFQRDQGLTVDGVVGPRTWERLKAYASA